MNLPAVLMWSFLTVVAYALCRRLFLYLRWPVLHPGLTGIILMVIILERTGRAYVEYERATAWITWLLGPAVVAMAVPIFQLRRVVRANLSALAIVLPLALGFATASMTLALAVLGLPRPVIAAGALKSITSPVAYRLAVDAGASTDAAMAGVMIAGMLGATLGPTVLRWLRVRDSRAVGLALGCASHGIGVARAVELGETAGAFASIGMTATAILGAIALPWLLRAIVGTG